MSQKILVIENNLLMLKMIQHTLAKAGYEFIEARTCEEARAAIVNEKPSLVVGGAKVVEDSLHPAPHQLSPQEKTAPIPVICMSNEPPTSTQAHHVDGEIVFTRPFSPMKLVAEVKRLSEASAAGGTI
jgi:two-component system, OmpR family, alkaline phosphatase synthesis response regulator PhoP